LKGTWTIDGLFTSARLNAARAGDTEPGGAVADLCSVAALANERGDGIRLGVFDGGGKRENEGDRGDGEVAGRIGTVKQVSEPVSVG
jgi:hypothetical protein